MDTILTKTCKELILSYLAITSADMFKHIHESYLKKLNASFSTLLTGALNPSYKLSLLWSQQIIEIW